MTSTVGEIRLIAWREFRRTVTSAKGIVSTILFLIGGALAILVYVGISNELDRSAAGGFAAAAGAFGHRPALMLMYGDAATVDALMASPWSLILFHKATLFFVPMLAILMGFDQIAGELQYKTIRYTTLRARRVSIVIGKALGAWAIVAAISLLLDAFVWFMVISQGGGSAGNTLWFGLRFWVVCSYFAGVYVALTALFSTIATTPVLALLGTLSAAFGWWLIGVVSHLQWMSEPVQWLRWITAGEYERFLLSPEPLTLLGGVTATAVFIALGIGGASIVLSRRDV